MKKLLFLFVVLFCITACKPIFKQEIEINLDPGYKLGTLTLENGDLNISAEPMENDYIPKKRIIELPGFVKREIIINETR